jgi:hypothetical protein
MPQYKVRTIAGGCITGNLNPNKLESLINVECQGGWRLSRSLVDQQRFLLLFSKNTHFLVFEREDDKPAQTQPKTPQPVMPPPPPPIS